MSDKKHYRTHVFSERSVSAASSSEFLDTSDSGCSPRTGSQRDGLSERSDAASTIRTVDSLALMRFQPALSEADHLEVAPTMVPAGSVS